MIGSSLRFELILYVNLLHHELIDMYVWRNVLDLNQQPSPYEGDALRSYKLTKSCNKIAINFYLL